MPSLSELFIEHTRIKTSLRFFTLRYFEEARLNVEIFNTDAKTDFRSLVSKIKR
jgi:hypothetical protein